jgi:hypothetical protein
LASQKLNSISMKKLILLSGILFSVTSIFAQYYEVTPMSGYTFSGDADNGYGTYDLKNSVVYGARLDVQVADLSYFELSVRRNDPSLSYSPAGVNESYDFNTGTAHYMLGFLREFQAGKIKPFGLISAGTSRYWIKEKDGVDENYRQWFFSTEFGLGAKMFFNENFGLRMQASVTTPWDFAGGGMYWGVGTGGAGASGSMTFGIPVAHWELSAGIIFRIRD